MALKAGTVIGGEYVIGRPLARGGMGAVYAAVQQSTGAERALKVMHPSLVGDDRLRTMFDREARASARVDSDHVVQVLAAGVDDESGSPWLVMELLEGETLAEAISRGPLASDDATRVMAELFHALGAAHGGLDPLIHRDLKPENIFLAKTKRRGETWTVKLLDFGIAKVIDDARGAGTTMPAGTPLWMAPEQADHGKVTPATDVWALGLIAFAIFTGKIYWKAAAPGRGASAGALLKEMLLAPIDAPSVRAAELGADAVPAWFDAWFLRCVAREPRERFQDASLARDAWDAAMRTGAVALGATAFAPSSPAPNVDTAVSRAEPKAVVSKAASRSGWRFWPVAFAATLAGAGAALLAVPRGSNVATAAEKNLAPSSSAHARTAITPVMTAWAREIVGRPMPPADDKTATEARRGELETVVNAEFVSADLKQAAMQLLAKLPAQRLPSSLIRSTVMEHAFPIALECYHAELKQHPDLNLKISIGFMVNGDGSVKNAFITDTTYEGPSLKGCMLRAFQGLKFPPTSDGEPVTVTYPISFAPG